MDDSTTDREPVTKAPYEAPSLVPYGSIAKLTQNSTGSQSDGSGMQSQQCL